tara:strand:+ start:546 stop:704 length:159 start_codon:yes stop_codon:yes gene_type:complete
MLNIFAIPAFTDNYIWTIVNDKEAIVIDLGDANNFLGKELKTTVDIFTTTRN